MVQQKRYASRLLTLNAAKEIVVKRCSHETHMRNTTTLQSQKKNGITRSAKETYHDTIVQGWMLSCRSVSQRRPGKS